ncbi:MAG: hypothetical protein CVT66_05675 [Actinobacteria bacterium HGW-Actinobacteria-6]|jgi:uncharacterized protein (TIGR01370 family)|nr:MAG: hypothetical protein CVT66_05675 [Actinobacteria bacterium HGW-Actinobacteria-6]
MHRRPLIAALAIVIAMSATACSLVPSTEPDVPDNTDAVATVPPSPTTELRQPRLSGASSWAMPLGAELDSDTIARLAGLGLVVVDGETTTASQVAEIQAGGATVLGYLSVGTIEPWRSWYPEMKTYQLEKWPEWDEYYADVSQEGFRSILMMQVAPAILGKGFDGLFLDNVDMIREHPAQAQGMERVLEGMSALVHQDGGVIAMQNGEDVIASMLPYIDVWNREDASFIYDSESETYRPVTDVEHTAALGALKRMRLLGILTLTLDYPPPGDAAATNEAMSASANAGAIPWTADIGLSQLD